MVRERDFDGALIKVALSAALEGLPNCIVVAVPDAVVQQAVG
jgi:hypothetical protein